jgi:L-arabinose isomerase
MNRNLEVWFVTGSQHLYGPKTLDQVASNAGTIAKHLDDNTTIPLRVVCKPTVKTPQEIYEVCRDANASPNCVGLITWMHTFSPSKMWIAGLNELRKPFAHLHTQFGRDIPWSEIDMNFMNLHQAAHGCREFGFICTRMNKNRAVIVGHWQDEQVVAELAIWGRVAKAWHESQQLKVARFGDNMREVAVTEGNKVSAQIRFGYSVSGYGIGDLVKVIDAVTPKQVDELMDEYHARYTIAKSATDGSIREQARIEIGMRTFLEDGGFGAFTTTFEDLHGLRQLPGLAVQRLMESGYGFGAEGDWKTAALMRTMKVMGDGLPGGTTFMEDYTYHLDPTDVTVLGAHMLEVCPSIAAQKPVIEVHRLGIGGKDDPARMVFTSGPGPAINVSPIDLGDRFRFIVSEVDCVAPPHDLPMLPVARSFWKPRPDLKTAAAAWILAGGAHHTVHTQQIDTRFIETFCEMADVELIVIDDATDLRQLKKELRWNKSAYH